MKILDRVARSSQNHYTVTQCKKILCATMRLDKIVFFSIVRSMISIVSSTFKIYFPTKEIIFVWYTANVYRELQGLCREIRVQGFQIYGDCMYTRNPCNLKYPHSDFYCNICREFDFAGILQGFPAKDVGKTCNNLIFWRHPCKICRDFL